MTAPASLRPRDLALLLLASGDLLPRQRARDQQADLAGLQLKRHILNRLVALDPEPSALDEALLQIVAEAGPPDGPVRALASSVREEWHTACANPEWIAHLLGEALDESGKVKHHGRQTGS